MKSKKLGIIEISFELLAKLLDFPEGHKIERVFESDKDIYKPRLFRVVVSG